MYEDIIIKSRFSGEIISHSESMIEEIENLRKNLENVPIDKRLSYIYKSAKPYLKEYKILESKKRNTTLENAQFDRCNGFIQFFNEQAEIYENFSAKNDKKLIEEPKPDIEYSYSADTDRSSKANQTQTKHMSKKQACEYIPVSMPTLNLWIKEGYLSEISIRGRKFISVASIEKCMAENEYNSSQPLKIKRKPNK
jgi:hypothetical protein